MENKNEQKQIMKDAFKEASKEWLEESMYTFGVWSFRTIGAALVIALGYFILTMNGWHK